MPPNEKYEQLETRLDHNSNVSTEKNGSMEYNKISASADYILSQTEHRPKLAIICGSGLAGLANLLQCPDVIEYADIPHFPISTVPGHKSRLLFGSLNGISVMLMQGRFHHYEGYSMQQVNKSSSIIKKLCE